jgi:predicted fused transcriptional regulator/phosphomethylpyrimidine kinase
MNRYDEENDMRYRCQMINDVISHHPTTPDIVLVEDDTGIEPIEF